MVQKKKREQIGFDAYPDVRRGLERAHEELGVSIKFFANDSIRRNLKRTGLYREK
jgi:hypothetical protein